MLQARFCTLQAMPQYNLDDLGGCRSCAHDVRDQAGAWWAKIMPRGVSRRSV